MHEYFIYLRLPIEGRRGNNFIIKTTTLEFSRILVTRSLQEVCKTNTQWEGLSACLHISLRLILIKYAVRVTLKVLGLRLRVISFCRWSPAFRRNVSPPSSGWRPPARSYGVTTQETTIDNFTTVTTLNLTFLYNFSSYLTKAKPIFIAIHNNDSLHITFVPNLKYIPRHNLTFLLDAFLWEGTIFVIK